jgi:hypothetical protein
MTTMQTDTAAARYAARVEAAITQRTRLRGEQPPGDLFGDLPPGHPLLLADPHQPAYANLEAVAEFLRPDDVLLDVGGGAGRISLPLALRCREVFDLDPSPAMTAAFVANAERGGLTNARAIVGDWLDLEPPAGDVALVAHVLYLTREVVPFIEKLARSARRRVIVIVGAPPPPTMNRALFPLLYGEEEAAVPGHAELLPVLWEMGILPDVRVLPPVTLFPPAPDRETAVAQAIGRFGADQWALWPLGPELETRLRSVLQDRFDALFVQTPDGYIQGWIPRIQDVLITWETGERS